MINGIINVYKEPGYTSHDVVARMRGIFKQKKIGHTGTLDPQAKGVLPVCLGHATRASDILVEQSKTYEVVGLLGLVTDTQDVFGKVMENNNVSSNETQIIEAIEKFMGEYDQIPPMYSAKKVNGKKLYELAREGKVIERKPRKVHIHDIEIKDINLTSNEIKLTVACSKGTYIRTLIHDIGQVLACGASMKELTRIRVGDFHISQSKTLEQLEDLYGKDDLESILTQVDTLFPYEKARVLEKFSKKIYNGNPVKISDFTNFEKDKPLGKVRLYDWQNKFIAIYEFDPKREVFKPFKMFL